MIIILSIWIISIVITYAFGKDALKETIEAGVVKSPFSYSFVANITTFIFFAFAPLWAFKSIVKKVRGFFFQRRIEKNLDVIAKEFEANGKTSIAKEVRDLMK